MDISEDDRITIGKIVNLVQQGQEQDGVAETILRPHVDQIIDDCTRMSASNPDVLAFVGDLAETCRNWALGDWADGTVQKLEDSVWFALSGRLRMIPGMVDASG